MITLDSSHALSVVRMDESRHVLGSEFLVRSSQFLLLLQHRLPLLHILIVSAERVVIESPLPRYGTPLLRFAVRAANDRQLVLLLLSFVREHQVLSFESCVLLQIVAIEDELRI